MGGAAGHAPAAPRHRTERKVRGPTATGPDGRWRCRWCAATQEYTAYHDSEWGFPVADDRRLFEKLSLEGFQAGLSWRTILAKRERFRAVFHQFDVERIARFTARDVERLLRDPGIVRHRGKIEAVIHNARRARELIRREGSLAAFLWRYEPKPSRRARPQGTPPIARIHRVVEGPEAGRVAVRGSHHDVCVHAGDGTGQRPCRGLRGPGHGRPRSPALQAARGRSLAGTVRFPSTQAADRHALTSRCAEPRRDRLTARSAAGNVPNG